MRQNLLFVGLLIIYNFFFWQQEPGINLVVFSLVLMLFAWQRHRPSYSHSLAAIGFTYLAGVFASIFYSSGLGFFTMILGSISWMGYVAVPSSVLEGFTSSVLSFFNPKVRLLPAPIGLKPKSGSLRLASLAMVPIFILVIYSVVFSAGNPVFKEYTASAFGNFFELFENISLTRFFFLLLGALILRWALMQYRKNHLKLNRNNFLSRRSGPKNLKGLYTGLRSEFQVAMMLFIGLNLLFAIVNFIDVKFVWFQFSHTKMALKDLLHEGFYWLILSLLMSIGFVLYFFRQNLNFYPNSKWLKRLAHLWIAQNVILALSVVLRCLYYIQYHGLASGRITVLIFLTMVFAGLISLFVKVGSKRNFAWILRVNSLAILLILGLSTTVNWSKLSMRYNLNHTYVNQIDVDYYLNLGPQNYPLLFDNLEKIERQILAHNENSDRWIRYKDPERFKEDLYYRAKKYLEKREQLKLYSWTFADWKAERELRERIKS